MMQFFKKTVTTAVDVVNSTMDELSPLDMPLHTVPSASADYPSSIGDDINLPLLVREMGARKKLKLSQRREDVLKELTRIDKELVQLDVLLDAANSL
jgi:hypothetical protein